MSSDHRKLNVILNPVISHPRASRKLFIFIKIIIAPTSQDCVED